MADLNRPKRIHRDPYGGYLSKLITEGDEAIRQLGGTPDPHFEPGPYEPDETEVALCRAALELIGRRFGPTHLRAAIIAAGIQSGEAIEDDFDFFLYHDAVGYIKETFGEAAEKLLLAQIEKRH